MQWTKRGAHLLLQIRMHALDGTLRPCSHDGTRAGQWQLRRRRPGRRSM